MIKMSIPLGDSFLSSSLVYFNSSSSIGETRCVQLLIANDEVVEGNEVVIIEAVARNSLDYFFNGDRTFSLTIDDDDGMANAIILRSLL